MTVSRAIDTATEFLRQRTQYTPLRKDGAPVSAHGIRIGEILQDLQLGEHIVVAGILHDIVEDTDVTVKEIEENFGATVAGLIDAVTKRNISNPKKADRDVLERSEAYGPDAVLIRLADNADNLKTLSALKPERQRTYLRFAKKVQEMGIRVLGQNHDLVIHHFRCLQEARMHVESLSRTHYAVAEA